jgi:hypothetical protein
MWLTGYMVRNHESERVETAEAKKKAKAEAKGKVGVFRHPFVGHWSWLCGYLGM